MDYRQHAIQLFDFQVLHLQLNTPLFILGLVLVVMACLHFLLFRPVLRTLDARQAELDRLQAGTEGQKAELAKLTESYRRDLDRARGEVEQVRQTAHQEAQKAQQAVLDGARKQAETHLRGELATLQEDVKQAQAALGRSARTLAQQTSQRILSA
jgi:F0F1-type ATP synthase membrane subunit b/b'